MILPVTDKQNNIITRDEVDPEVLVGYINADYTITILPNIETPEEIALRNKWISENKELLNTPIKLISVNA